MKKTVRAVLPLLLLALAIPGRALPRLLVVVSVDQMRADYLQREGYTAGLKALREGGAVFTDAQHAHIPTETGPGHAVILTGQYPDRTGIVGNEWLDLVSGTTIYC